MLHGRHWPFGLARVTPEEIDGGKLYRQMLNCALSVNEGMLFEDAIAQCLVARLDKCKTAQSTAKYVPIIGDKAKIIFENMAKYAKRIFG